MEDWKEDTKRRSKTFKRLIGHWVPNRVNPFFNESINVNTDARNRKEVLRFIDKFLPEHSEMRNWEQGVDYSLKKNGRWKLLDKVKEAWQNQSRELALFEKEVTVDHLVTNVHQHQVLFSQRFRNHGDIVQKSKITRGFRTGQRNKRLQVWEEGDPSQVQIIAPAKANKSYKSRFKFPEDKNDISITVWTAKSDSGIYPPQKYALKSHASDKYTRRSLHSKRKYINEHSAKTWKSKVHREFEFEFEEEEEEEFSLSNLLLDERRDDGPCCYGAPFCNHWPKENEESLFLQGFIWPNFLPKERVEVQLFDLIASSESIKKSKRSKHKRKRMEPCSEGQKKSKLFYMPKNNNPSSFEVLHNPPIGKEEETLIEEVKIFEISFDSLDIPLNSGWKVVYSQTEPTICEVWRGKTSLMLMFTSMHTALVQVSTSDHSSGNLDDQRETIASICQKIDKEPKARRDVSVCYDEDSKIDFYSPNVAQRYLTDEDPPQESDALDLSRMEMANWEHLGTECGICLCECPPLELGCGHCYCTPCWRRWLASPGGVSARCPHPGCSTLLDIVTHHWLAGPRLFQETRAAMLTSRLTSDPSILRCRCCRRVVRRRDLTVTRVTCICGAGTCVRCGQEDHWPASCSELAKFTKFNAVYSDLKKLEEEVEVRGCPKCGLLWEKMWGCNHMVCSSCHTSFCWGCGQYAAHHSNGWCDHITVPLETRTITPVPTEMALMKQIELFIIAKTIRNQTREFAPIKKSESNSLWMKSVVDTFNHSKQVLKYGLLCDRTLKSKRLLAKLQIGIASMVHLRELLKEKKQTDHWRSLVKLYVHNVSLATKSICKR